MKTPYNYSKIIIHLIGTSAEVFNENKLDIGEKKEV